MGKLGVPFIFMLGFLAYAGMNLFFRETDTLEFCTSCHTMEKPFTEYKETVHYKNHSGIRATCSDCHVPGNDHPVAKIWAKIYAAKDIWHEIIGTIDTPEKFEAHRWEMANRVWDKMKRTDSRECRSCHSWDAMQFSEQDKSAAKKHQRAKKEGKTCIDCHKGIAHEEPEEPEAATVIKTASDSVTNVQGKKADEAVSDDASTAASTSSAAATTTPKKSETPSSPAVSAVSNTDATDAGPLTDLVNGCNQCHGKNGNSHEDKVPSIAKASTLYLYDTLMAFKNGKRKAYTHKDADNKVTDMNKLAADLSEDQITKLAEYYSGKPFIPFKQSADMAKAEKGAKLFDKKCEKCHSDGGTNPEDDAGIIAGQPRGYLVEQFKHFDNGDRKIPRKMAKKIKKLSPAQKQEIIEFLIK